MRSHSTSPCATGPKPVLPALPACAVAVAVATAAALGALPVPAQAQGVAPASAPAPAVAPAATALTYGRADGNFSVTLVGAQTNTVRVRRDGRDLLLEFAEATPAFDAAELQARATGWLDGVSVGHDALLLRLSEGVDAQTDSPAPGSLTLRLTRSATRDDRSSAAGGASPSGASPSGASPSGAFRLELLRARVSEQEGDLGSALERYAALRDRQPRQLEPLLGLAGAEAQVGRWRRSLALYREAEAIAPADPAPSRAAAALERAQGGVARLDLEQRRSRGGESAAPVTVDLAAVEASHRWSEAWKLGLGVDSVSLDTEAVQRADGTLRPASDRRTRAALFAQHDGLDGTVHTVSLYAGSTGGLGLSRRMVDERGTTTLVLEAHRAWWELAEAIVERAHRDRLALARTQRFGGSLTGRAELGLNRYGLQDASGVARSTSLAGELRWSGLGLLSGLGGLSAAYRLDAEYVGDLEQRTRPGGTLYAPLPLLDREVHSAVLDFAGPAGWPVGNGSLTWGAQLGVGKDRYGRSGSIAAASLTWTHAALVAQLRGNHVRNIGRARGTSEGVAATLSAPF